MLLFFGPTDNWVWDPSFYFALLRSPIIDGDLDIGLEVFPPDPSRRFQYTAWPMGPSILWSPFFLVAHLAASILSPSTANGLSPPYIALVSFGSAMYGALGLWIVYKICRLFTDRYLALITAILCAGASPLLFYMFRQPIMAHSTGFLAYACLLYIFLKLESSPPGISGNQSGLLFGVFSGLCVLTRWAGGLMLLFPLVYFSSRFLEAWKLRDRTRIKALFKQGLIFTLVFLVALSPQMIFWYRLTHKFIISPQGAAFYVNTWLPVNTFKIIFSTNRGMLFWSPFILLGLIGLFWFPNRKIRFTMLAFGAMVIILYGYRKDWYGGGGFGTRFLIEVLPVAAVGFVSLWTKFQNIRLRNAVLTLVTLILVLQQFTLMHAVEHGFEPGWVNLERYFQGAPLGLRVQLTSLARLGRDPGQWLALRPFVDKSRQTILVSLVHGERNLNNYLIPGMALLAALVMVPLFAILHKNRQRVGFRGVAVLLLAYLAGWAAYLYIL
jgi:hypothetical protein